jgi:hypothetical protein
MSISITEKNTYQVLYLGNNVVLGLLNAFFATDNLTQYLIVILAGW